MQNSFPIHVNHFRPFLPLSLQKGPTHIEQSVELAKKAVALDVKDGHSWYILGNAYMALFFAKMGVVAHLLSALKAYSRAEADAKEAKNNPDLYFNRSMVGSVWWTGES